jgi:hypothetical protein
VLSFKTSFFIFSVLFASFAAGFNAGGEGLYQQAHLAVIEMRAGMLTLRDDIPDLKGFSRQAAAFPRRLYKEVGADLESLEADASAKAERAQEWAAQYRRRS